MENRIILKISPLIYESSIQYNEKYILFKTDHILGYKMHFSIFKRIEII